MAKPGASILVVDDEELIRWSLERDLASRGYQVTSAASGEEALARQAADAADVVLLDINLPDGSGIQLIPRLVALRDDTVIIMITSDTALDSAVESVRQGAWDYVTKPFNFPKLYDSIAKALERASLRSENRALRARGAGRPTNLIAVSAGMRDAFDLAERVMHSDPATVLLLGESGVGKDVLARHIHKGSARAERLFLDLNCATLPDTLLESELFGHERGAFTDAKSAKPGLFELASGGTVYLDEIGDAPLTVQAKLLKVLEQRTFRRVGGARDLPADIRLIAATNRDLVEAIATKHFREDLYYRLNVFPIVIPPLRERRDDVLPLARLFLSNFNQTFRKRVEAIDPAAESALLGYAWPGNVRELRNLIERAMILARDEQVLSLELLPADLRGANAEDGPAETGGVLAQAEAQLIRDALREAAGNQSKAAAQLGISRGALARKLKRLKLEPGES